MRAILGSLLAALLATPASAAAEKHGIVSWGKAGVSFAEYRNDAIQCGRKGYYRDVAGTEAAQVFKAASRQLETNEGSLQSAALLGNTEQVAGIVGNSARIVEGTRPEKRMKEVGALLNETVATCLAARGYRRFQLTPAQQRQLDHLRRGTPRRHEFLYSLGSDPKVLAEQAV